MRFSSSILLVAVALIFVASSVVAKPFPQVEEEEQDGTVVPAEGTEGDFAEEAVEGAEEGADVGSSSSDDAAEVVETDPTAPGFSEE